MLSMGVRRTMHWQMPGRLVQELTVRTVEYALVFTRYSGLLSHVHRAYHEFAQLWQKER